MINNKKRGTTLIEMLVAVALFAVISTIAAQILLDVVQIEQKSTIQNVFYEDARIILQQISNEIQSGTIDYDEYYNRYVIGSDYLGTNFGVYGGRFYAPGKSLTGGGTSNPDNLGVECSYPTPAPDDIADCEIIYTLSTDSNTGQNPFDYGSTAVQEDSNALCDNPGGSDCNNMTGEVNELFLISSDSSRKTMIGRKKMKVNSGGIDDYAIGIVRMEGQDIDQNGIMDTYSCAAEYSCDSDPTDISNEIEWDYMTSSMVSQYGIRLPKFSDLEVSYEPRVSHFVPISPMKSSIVDLKFIIHPIEDPYRAFAEEAVQSHPSVTIIITIGLSEAVKENYPGNFDPITVQTTVAAGVLGKINSYPPTNDVSWMADLLIPETGL